MYSSNMARSHLRENHLCAKSVQVPSTRIWINLKTKEYLLHPHVAISKSFWDLHSGMISCSINFFHQELVLPGLLNLQTATNYLHEDGTKGGSLNVDNQIFRIAFLCLFKFTCEFNTVMCAQTMFKIKLISITTTHPITIWIICRFLISLFSVDEYAAFTFDGTGK